MVRRASPQDHSPPRNKLQATPVQAQARLLACECDWRFCSRRPFSLRRIQRGLEPLWPARPNRGQPVSIHRLYLNPNQRRRLGMRMIGRKGRLLLVCPQILCAGQDTASPSTSIRNGFMLSRGARLHPGVRRSPGGRETNGSSKLSRRRLRSRSSSIDWRKRGGERRCEDSARRSWIRLAGRFQ